MRFTAWELTKTIKALPTFVKIDHLDVLGAIFRSKKKISTSTLNLAIK